MAICQFVPVTAAFASGMIGYLDCQAQALGTLGYGALAAPGSSALLLLTASLTIFVALIGMRTLLGQVPSISDLLLWAVKIGAVSALATSWPAYQALVYDVALRAPAEIAAEIGAPAGLPGSGGGLPARIDAIDRSYEVLTIAGIGIRNVDLTKPGPATAPGPFPGFDMFAMGMARIVFLSSAVGSFALLRLSAGLLLALGPLFVAFLLFDTTRGLFEGWARGLIGTALGSVSTATILGVELALFEPWLKLLIARRAGGQDIVGMPTQLFAASLIFAVVIAASMALLGRVAFGLGLPQFRAGPGSAIRRSDPILQRLDRHGRANDSLPPEARSRAQRVGDSIAAMQRREELTRNGFVAGAGQSARSSSPAAAHMETRRDAGGLRESDGRRIANRVSASAGARDRR